MKAVLLCPGQGAQRVGMGRDLAQAFPAAREVFEAVDDALGLSLSRLMWQGTDAELTLTHNAQPAIFTHTLAVYALVREVVRPVLGAGHSLGEYSALAAAGALSVADGARLVRRRGELMYQAGQRRPGTMAAVLGLSADTVEAVCREVSREAGTVVPANLNAPDQTVVSGDPDAVALAGARLKDAGAKRVLSVKVSGAFHSPLMEPAAAGLREELARVAFADPTFAVVANATAQPVTDAASARDALGAQLTAPVKWVASMERAGSDLDGEATFVEVGPGSVLCGLLRRILPDVPSVALGSADQVTQFLERHA